MSDPSQAAPVQGQAAAAPVGSGQASPGWSPISYKGSDGKDVSFATRDDFEKEMRDSHFRMQDYTKKTQTLAEFRKQVEKEKSEFQKQREDLERKAREYTDFDWLIKNRPDVYKQLQSLSQKPASPDVFYEQSKSYADEQSQAVKKELEELRSQMEEDRLQRQRGELVGRLRGEYQDFPDDNTLNSMLEELGSGDLEKLLRFAYDAHRGRNPQAVEKRLAEAQKDKRGLKLMPSSGSAPDTSKKFKNLDEAADEGLKMLGG